MITHQIDPMAATDQIKPLLHELQPGATVAFAVQGQQLFNRRIYGRIGSVAHHLWGKGAYAMSSCRREITVTRRAM